MHPLNDLLEPQTSGLAPYLCVQASLALSTEPVVRAYVFPQLTKLLKQTPWQALPKRPSKYAKKRDWFAFFFTYFMAFFWDVLFLFPSLVSKGRTLQYYMLHDMLQYYTVLYSTVQFCSVGSGLCSSLPAS